MNKLIRYLLIGVGIIVIVPIVAVGIFVAVFDANAYKQDLSELVREHLPGVHYRMPEGTYVSWLDFRDTPLADDPAEFFKKHANVHMSSGASCGESFDGFARFIFATPHPVMVTALQRMGKAMRNRKAA